MNRSGPPFAITRRRLIQGSCLAGAAALSERLLFASSPGAAPPDDLSPPDKSLFYRPADAWVGDVIPFYEDGLYRIFYLHDWRDPAHHGRGSSWYQVATRDFVRFENIGEALPRGTPEDADPSVATGCVIHVKGQYHAFYTGYSSVRKKQGLPEQGICHAVSDDLVHWRKLPEHTFFPDEHLYGKDAWRDPFVFWNEQAKEYWMLCAARLTSGPHRRRGCIGLCTSTDLERWTVLPPFYAPSLFEDHECPDLFRLGDWWYLIFSEFSDQTVTRYRMSRSIEGPWITPKVDTFDGRAFYAAKTAGDDKRRVLFGWIPTRNENRDAAIWNWGGNLGVHEITQLPDGTLGVKMPATIRDTMQVPFPLRRGISVGDVEERNGILQLHGRERFAAQSFGDMPARCRIEAVLSFSDGTRRCGLMLHGDPTLNTGYSLRLDVDRKRCVVEAYPRPDGNSPYLSGLERPLHLAPGKRFKLSVLIDDNITIGYIDDRVALTSRMNILQSSTGRYLLLRSDSGQ